LMFHVEHSPLRPQPDRLTTRFWRGGASSAATTFFQRLLCASMSAKAKNVKSFLRVWAKLFLIGQVFLRQ